MKKIIGLLLIASLSLTNCNNRQSSEYNELMKKEFEKLNNILKRFEEPSQRFTESSENPSLITGNHGTIIAINPKDLISETNEPLGKEIEIELREVTTQNQFLNANIQTVSNKRLLVSGGAYYINITSQGKQLKLQEGKSLKVEFPKLTDTEMFLFYGQRDSIGKMEWQQAKDTFKIAQAVTIKDAIVDTIVEFVNTPSEDLVKTLTKGEKEKLKLESEINEKVYSAIDIKSFGWINCDRFIEIQNKTNLLIDINPADNVCSENIFLVFKDINSVMQSHYFYYNGKTVNEGFKNVPVGYNVRLVAYSIKNEKVFSYTTDLTINENQTLKLDLKESSNEELKELFRNEEKK